MSDYIKFSFMIFFLLASQVYEDRRFKTGASFRQERRLREKKQKNSPTRKKLFPRFEKTHIDSSNPPASSKRD